MRSITAAWSDRQRVMVLALCYALALGLILRFIMRQSFAVPNFIYQNF